MKRVLAALLVFALLFVPLPTDALETKALNKVLQSVVRLNSKSGGTYCTGFVVMPGHIMTAAHCVDPEFPLSVDGLATEVIKQDRLQDLALLKVPGLRRPYLLFSKKAPEIGMQLTAIGFPYGGSTLIVLDRKLAGMNLVLESCNMYTRGCVEHLYTIVVNGTYAPGMSGGPNVDEKGHIVSITQAGIGTLGLGQSAEVMKDFLR